MKKVYIGIDLNSPSRTIFFKFQLPYILEKDQFSKVSNLLDADVVFIPYSTLEIKKILNSKYYSYIKNKNIDGRLYFMK